MKKLFTLLLALMATTALWAEDFSAGGIYYKILTDKTNEVEVTYRGDQSDSYSNEYSGSVTIPSSVTYNGTTYSVTRIGVCAFYFCRSLTSVTIPNSVTSIGESAFRSCSSLTSITIPNSVTSIGDYAFRDCSSLTSIVVESGNTIYDSRDNCNAIIETATNTLIAGCQNTVIPYSVTSIGFSAFSHCSSLTSITIPNSVTSIGGWAFDECSSLTKTNYTGDVAGWCNIKFGDYSANPISYSHNFYINDQEIKDLVIPNTVDSIHDYAFAGCSSLTSVTIPNSVTSIGGSAFSHCSSLTSITIPNSVTSIGFNAFSHCDSLTKTNYTGDIAGWCNIKFGSFDANPISCSHNLYINNQEIKDLVIPTSVNSIHKYAFEYCSSLTSITIPNSVTSIRSYAFSHCSSLTSITIPNSVTSIGRHAFSGCSSLTSIVVESGNTIYDSRDNCNAIIETATNTLIAGCQNTIIPNSVTSIGHDAFFFCSSLTSITCLGTTPPTLGTDVFYGTKLSAVYIPDNTLSAYQTAWGNEYAFVNNENTLTLHVATPGTLEDLIFDAGTRPALVAKLILTGTLNDADFTCMGETMTSLVDVDLSGITNTDGVYFNAKSKLVKIILPANLTSIGERAFYICSSLTSITIPNSVTSIGDEVFSGCSSLTSITIPNSVTSIGERAFSHCSSLTSVTIPNSVTSIGDEVFSGCTSLTSITIPNSVTSIEERAFSHCSSLTSVTIPNSVTSIASTAFHGCTSLTSVVWDAKNCNDFALNNNKESYPTSPFYNLRSKITLFSFGEDVEHIPAYLCYGLDKLNSITIPKSVTSIGNAAFYGCSSLTKTNYTGDLASWCNIKFDDNSANPISYSHNFYINDQEIKDLVIPNTVDSIHHYAFYGCNALTSVTIGNSVTSIGDWAFYDCSSLSSVAIGNGVTEIRTSAFAGCTGLNLLRLGTGIQNIAANAFAACTKLYDIYCLAAEPPTGYTSSFANYNAFLHVPCESQRLYMLDILFGEFKYIECIASDEVTTDDIVITPGSTDVTITWPTENNADTYTIVIKKDGEVVCTLTFNADGQLLNIAFAPGREGNHPAQYAEATANGYRFTVTGLEEGTDYTYTVTSKDAANKTISEHSGEFTTQSTTALDNTHSQSPITNCQKILRNGHLLIIRDGVEYNAIGQEL